MNFLSRALSLLDEAPQNINKEEFQLERVRLQAFVAATDPGCKKELIREAANFRSAPGGKSPRYATALESCLIQQNPADLRSCGQNVLDISFKHLWVIGNGPRNFEPRSSGKKNTRAGTPLSKLLHPDNVRILALVDLTCIGGSLEAPGLEPVTLWPRVHYDYHLATSAAQTTAIEHVNFLMIVENNLISKSLV
ncbi:hypothetical protein TNCV_1718871 [Trichonephila clavipes]|nr:hypothetical protein TNCV_1718871 [Trichonephila clavipes]